jgi:hypothetical protein
MLVALLYAVAIACGVLSIITFGRSVYHSWSRRGDTRRMLANGVGSVALGFGVVVTLLFADQLQNL